MKVYGRRVPEGLKQNVLPNAGPEKVVQFDSPAQRRPAGDARLRAVLRGTDHYFARPRI